MEKMNFEQLQTPQLEFAHRVPEIWNKLAQIPRTGWKRRGVNKPESVQEHTTSLRDMAFLFSQHFSKEDQKDLLDMLELHDWAEAITGDTVIITNDAEERKRLKAEKKEKERTVMLEICHNIGGDIGPRMFALWTRFETSDDEVAFWGRQLDKYQAIERALDYEKTQNIPLFREFKDYSEKINEIVDPILVEKLALLEQDWQNLQEGKTNN
jgi:5'-deoxynucleotidase YfbR-like HD superfamily hydrolase